MITESGGSESNTVTEAGAIGNDVPSVTVTETFESVTLAEDEKAEDKIKEYGTCREDLYTHGRRRHD